MKKEKRKKDFLRKPIYPGGIKAIRKLIREQLQYPEAARAAGTEGTVHLRYTINYQGKVIDVKVVSGLGYGCDEEAVRLVKLLRFEVPKNRKAKVLFHKTIQIHFRLPQTTTQPTSVPEAQTPQPKIQYQYLPKVIDRTARASSPPAERKIYRYSIRIREND